MSDTTGTPASPKAPEKPEWQWGRYHPTNEDEQRRMFVLEMLTNQTWETDGSFLATLELVDAWLLKGKVPPPEGEKKKPRLGTV